MSGLLMRARTETASSVQLDSPRSTISATALSKICSRRLSGDMRCARLFAGINRVSPKGQADAWISILRETYGGCGDAYPPHSTWYKVRHGETQKSIDCGRRRCAGHRRVVGRIWRGLWSVQSILCAEQAAVQRAAVRPDQGPGLSAGNRGRDGAAACRDKSNSSGSGAADIR